MVRPRVFFDVSVDNSPIGRLIFELFNETAPKTCENFRALCTGEKGLSSVSEHPLYYKGSILHRCIKDFMIQGGDFTKRNGMGGESIYGSPFPDEDLTRPLDAEGLLCMANRGPNTNGSQFFITLRDCPHLNGKHVVFGRVIRGYSETVQRIIDVPVDEKDRPLKTITIINCGELVLKAKSEQPKEERRTTDVRDSEPKSDDSDSELTKKRRHRHRSSSPEDLINDKERHRRHRKKSKHKRRISLSQKSSHKGDDDAGKNPQEQETEEQYDARLEREETERLEAENRRELERLKKRMEQAEPPKNGVNFKGRGRMKYVDPETRRGDSYS